MTLQITPEEASRLSNLRAFRHIQVDTPNHEKQTEKINHARTQRNEKILNLAHAGKSSAYIASECRCSPETVRVIKNRYLRVDEKRRARNQEIRNLLLMGRHPKYVAKTCGVSVDIVYAVRGGLLDSGVELLGAVPVCRKMTMATENCIQTKVGICSE